MEAFLCFDREIKARLESRCYSMPPRKQRRKFGLLRQQQEEKEQKRRLKKTERPGREETRDTLTVTRGEKKEEEKKKNRVTHCVCICTPDKPLLSLVHASAGCGSVKERFLCTPRNEEVERVTPGQCTYSSPPPVIIITTKDPKKSTRRRTRRESNRRRLSVCRSLRNPRPSCLRQLEKRSFSSHRRRSTASPRALYRDPPGYSYLGQRIYLSTCLSIPINPALSTYPATCLAVPLYLSSYPSWVWQSLCFKYRGT